MLSAKRWRGKSWTQFCSKDELSKKELEKATGGLTLQELKIVKLVDKADA